MVAVQGGGTVIASMPCSFTVQDDGPDAQITSASPAGSPEELADFRLPRVYEMEGRLPEQPYLSAESPSRFRMRATEELPDDDVMHACVLTYLSDIGTGLGMFEGTERRSRTSIGSAVWFHRVARLDDWVLTDLVPHSVAGGRGWYSGSVFDAPGRLAASLTQAVLSRPTPYGAG